MNRFDYHPLYDGLIRIEQRKDCRGNIAQAILIQRPVRISNHNHGTVGGGIEIDFHITSYRNLGVSGDASLCLAQHRSLSFHMRAFETIIWSPPD